jgi:hypothetical protein
MPRQRNPATFSCDDAVVFGLPARHGLSPDIDIANPANGRDIPEMHLLDSVVTMFHGERFTVRVFLDDRLDVDSPVAVRSAFDVVGYFLLDLQIAGLGAFFSCREVGEQIFAAFVGLDEAKAF